MSLGINQYSLGESLIYEEDENWPATINTGTKAIKSFSAITTAKPYHLLWSPLVGILELLSN